MPAGNLKNTLYHLALPVLGLRSPIASVQGGVTTKTPGSADY